MEPSKTRLLVVYIATLVCLVLLLLYLFVLGKNPVSERVISLSTQIIPSALAALLSFIMIYMFFLRFGIKLNQPKLQEDLIDIQKSLKGINSSILAAYSRVSDYYEYRAGSPEFVNELSYFQAIVETLNTSSEEIRELLLSISESALLESKVTGDMAIVLQSALRDIKESISRAQSAFKSLASGGNFATQKGNDAKDLFLIMTSDQAKAYKALKELLEPIVINKKVELQIQVVIDYLEIAFVHSGRINELLSEDENYHSPIPLDVMNGDLKRAIEKLKRTQS